MAKMDIFYMNYEPNLINLWIVLDLVDLYINITHHTKPHPKMLCGHNPIFEVYI